MDWQIDLNFFLGGPLTIREGSFRKPVPAKTKMAAMEDILDFVFRTLMQEWILGGAGF
jgi:hypothetical protein